MENNKENKFCKLKIPKNLISSNKYFCPKIVKLPSWDVAKEIFNTAADQWIFRGQDDSSFGLLPSLYRFGSCIDEISLEGIFLTLFKADVIENYQEIKHCNPRTKFEWLCIKQHYGIPTRLLDWTKSPYVAVWFASYLAYFIEHPSCAVWAVNKEWCKYHAFSQIRSIEKYANLSDDVDLSSDEYFEDLFIRNDLQYKLNFVFPFEIPERFRKIESFKRMNNQQSIFLCAGNDYAGCFGETEFRENLCFGRGNKPTLDEIINEREDYIIKFIIENRLLKGILEDLKSSGGITHSHLFNSIDQYSQYVLRSVKAIDNRNKKFCNKFSAKQEIDNKFGDDKSWQEFFKDPEQLVIKDNFFLQSLLESNLDIFKKMTLLNIWRGSYS